MGWLARASGRDSVHVVAMHIPPLDPLGVRNGAFASRAEAASLVARSPSTTAASWGQGSCASTPGN